MSEFLNHVVFWPCAKSLEISFSSLMTFLDELYTQCWLIFTSHLPSYWVYFGYSPRIMPFILGSFFCILFFTYSGLFATVYIVRC